METREVLIEKKVTENQKELVSDLIEQSLNCKGTNYFKILIEGHTGIYYASAIYKHSDYNKTRIFDKNSETLKLMNWFNAEVTK